MPRSWEAELVRFLTQLSEVQADLLTLIQQKQQLLRKADGPGLAAMIEPEKELIERLKSCHQARNALLAQAGEEGLPSNSLRQLSQALPREERTSITPQMDAAASRMRILQHQSLTNWVVVQRTLLHLTRMIEIIATGGRLKPTYGKGESAPAGGTMLDRAA